MTLPDLVEIGVIARSHGIRGGLRVHLWDATSAVLSDVTEVRVGGRLYQIESASRDRADYLIKLAEVSDRDAADRMRGQPVVVPRSVLPPPGDDEVYISDLPGCEVVDTDGRRLGQVVSVLPGAGQDLLVLDCDGKEGLVPFVEPIVVSVDLVKRRIVCDPPEGLFDLDAGPKSAK